MRLVLALVFAVGLVACGREDGGKKNDQSEGGSGGTAGSTTTGGASTGGSSGSGMNEVASVLDGFVLKQPCLTGSGTRACRTAVPGACPVTEDPGFSGAKPTDEMLTFGGEPGTLYDVTLRVQGIVESKEYRGGSDASDLATDGFHRAGIVDNTMNQHSVFGLRVTAPIGIYFWNSIGKDSVHATFPVDYEATLTIQGQTPLELWVSDPNCQALKNCAEPDTAADCTPVDLPNLDPKIATNLGSSAKDYDGQFLGLTVIRVVLH
jgi:hypothetical protein